MGDTFLTCAICGRDNLLRLTRHLNQVHGIRPENYLKEHPGAVLEIPPTKAPLCKSCGAPVDGCSPRSANVKCTSCRKMRPHRMVAEGGLVQCLVCGLWFKSVSAHLKLAHGVSTDQYLKDHPGVLLELPGWRGHTEATREKISLTRKLKYGAKPKPSPSIYIPRCATCGVEVMGYPPTARNVKCDGCRQTPLDLPGEAPGKVTCRICGKSRRMLTPHLQAAHGMTREVYLTSYPDAPVNFPGVRTRSESCRQKQSQRATLRWSHEEERRKQSVRLLKAAAAWRGKSLTESHRGSISKGGTGVPHKITPEYRIALGVRGRSHLEIFRISPNASAKLAQGVQRRLARGERWGLMLPEVRRKSLESRIRNGTLLARNAGRGICGFRAGIPHFCRSTFEANFTRVLMHLGVPYEYEPHLFKLSDGTYYTPDFYLTEAVPVLGLLAGWVELKGWRLPNGMVAKQAKIDLFIRETGHPVTVITMHDDLWKNLESQYSNILPWETHNRNLRTHPEIFGRVP